MTLRPRLPGFRGRLLIAMLALALVTSVTIAAIFMLSTFQDEEYRARERLDVASDVMRELLARRTQLLIDTLSVLVDDFGFRSAVASKDEPTITSALENQSQRFKADIAMLADRNGRLLANLQGLPNGTQLPFNDLLQRAERQGAATGLLTWQGQAFQALLVPVQAPGLRAWLVMGFNLDDAFARMISELTGVDVVFTAVAPETAYYGRSLSDDAIDDVVGQGALASRSKMTGDHRYFTRVASLSRNGEEAPVNALLLLDRQTALAHYYKLALELGLIVLACLAIAGLLAFGLARALGRPVLLLARFASDLGSDPATPSPGLSGQDELGQLQNALGDMAHRIRRREHRIRHDANHDSLTGLPNRKAMQQVLRPMLTQQQPAFLLSLSINGLKELSETLGYDLGDQILIAAALRMRGVLDAHCLLARTGGNEFMTVIPGLDESHFHAVLGRLRAAAEEPVVIRDTPVTVELSAAVLQLPQDARSLDDIRRRVSLTLERARHDDTRTAFYLEGGDEHHLRELQIIRDLQKALADDQLEMLYQPKVRFDTAHPVQVEALVRWAHPALGPISPDEFIGLAERSGQIHELTDYILRRVARDSHDWAGAGLSDLGVAINLSALDLLNHSLPNLISTVFADGALPLNRLTFEITESVAMADTQTALRTLNRLRDLGAKLSVDDFGTGYSSLAQMRQLPVHELKIDKSFVLSLDSTQQDQLIVRSTIDMAHSLGLGVVAEGIENELSWRLLQAWGCDLGQGYLLGRPMRPSQLAAWHRDRAEQARALAADTSTIDP